QFWSDAPLWAPILPVRRVIGWTVGIRVWADPGQLASRRTSHDGEFCGAERAESSMSKEMRSARAAVPNSSGRQRARVVEGTTPAPWRSRPELSVTSRGVGSRTSTGYEE